MGPGTCLRTNLINQCGGKIFHQRGVSPKERIPTGIASLNEAIDVLARQFLHLIVHATHKARRCDQGEQLCQQVLFDTRKAARCSFERRELEGASSSLDQSGYRCDAMVFVDRGE
ncbi:hypothetical protein ACFQDJ_30800 [Pseudomonas brassicacearum]